MKFNRNFAILLLAMSEKAGILRDKTIDDKFKYIPNNDKQNYPFFILIICGNVLILLV